jgi:hypothetical protein
MSFTFQHVDVKSEIVNQLKRELPKFNFGNVKVIKADPLTQAEMPCIGINRVDDNESEQSLADAQGHFYDAEMKEYRTFYGTFFQESLEVRVWHTNADERDRLGLHTKAILFAIRPSLVEKGLLNITLRSGRDEQDSTMQQANTALYWTSITMSYLNPMDVTFVSTVEPISAVTVTTRMKG